MSSANWAQGVRHWVAKRGRHRDPPTHSSPPVGLSSPSSSSTRCSSAPTDGGTCLGSGLVWPNPARKALIQGEGSFNLGQYPLCGRVVLCSHDFPCGPLSSCAGGFLCWWHSPARRSVWPPSASSPLKPSPYRSLPAIDQRECELYSSSCRARGIAQPGSAPALGAGSREFKSLYPDHTLPSARSSTGQSIGLLSRWLKVRILPGAPSIAPRARPRLIRLVFVVGVVNVVYVVSKERERCRMRPTLRVGRLAERGAGISVVGVAQRVEPRIVDPVVVGSSPITHPNDLLGQRVCVCRYR